MYKRMVTKELEEKAREELNETPKKREESARHIKEWISKQPHLNARTDDLWIVNFLRGCKFNTEKTKEKLEHLYTIKTLTPEFFSNRDPLLPELQEILKRSIFLPYGTENEEVMIIRWRNSNANKVSLENFFKVASMILDIHLCESSTFLILGYHVIVDMKDFPLTYVKQLTPALIKKLVDTFFKSYPIRFKGLYFINIFPYFHTIYNMVKPLLSKKIVSKVKIYSEGDSHQIHKDIAETALPQEYGGKGERLSEIGERWKTTIESYKQWFLDDEQHRSNENLRRAKSDVSHIFGAQGSFRQLELD